MENYSEAFLHAKNPPKAFPVLPFPHVRMPQNTFTLISCLGLPQFRSACICPAPFTRVYAIGCGLCHGEDRYFFTMAHSSSRFIVSAIYDLYAMYKHDLRHQGSHHHKA